jgi:hypothetical protein
MFASDRGRGFRTNYRKQQRADAVARRRVQGACARLGYVPAAAHTLIVRLLRGASARCCYCVRAGRRGAAVLVRARSARRSVRIKRSPLLARAGSSAALQAVSLTRRPAPSAARASASSRRR